MSALPLFSSAIITVEAKSKAKLSHMLSLRSPATKLTTNP